MTHSTENKRPRYQAVLKPLEWEQRMRVGYRDDVLRIMAVLAADGIAISEDVAFMAWHRFSEEDRCAGWYGPGTDDEIRRNLMPHLELRAFAEGAESATAHGPLDNPDHDHPMSDVEHHSVSTALALMRMALALLDRAGRTLVAARLQHAIDTVGMDAGAAAMPRRPDAPSGAEHDRQKHQRPTDNGEGTDP